MNYGQEMFQRPVAILGSLRENKKRKEANKMDNPNKKDDRSTWVVGGTTLIGIGVGFIFLKTSALLFVASILIGIGVGLVVTSLISSKNK